MAVYDPAFSNRLPEWLANLVSTTGVTNAAAFLKTQIPQVSGAYPQLFIYYLGIMGVAYP